MEIKSNYYTRWSDPNAPRPADDISHHIGTTIWACCYNGNRTTFPQKVVIDSRDWVKLFDKKGNVGKKQLAVYGVGDGSNILQMFTDKQECIDRWAYLVDNHIKYMKQSIFNLEADIIKHENLIIEANKL